MRYMPTSTRSNKETQLLFSLDPASLERSIRKEARSSSIDNTTCSSIDFCQPPSTQTLVPSTDTILAHHNQPKTLIFRRPTSSIRHRSILQSEHRSILSRETCGEGREAARRRFRSRKSDEFQWITLVSIDAKPRTSLDRGHPKSIDVLSCTSLDNTYGINRILQSCEDHDSRGVRSKTSIDILTPPALSTPKPKPSENPPETVRTPSDDGVDPMEVDRVPKGRTLRKRKEKVVKHLKRRANEKEKESFQKRVFGIPLEAVR
ncbi:hypothetical protein DY000_02020303 [Brassica cretica]|uniref:Uncharacterized protein n=1 Tax=Brassica cretica TaxID=69181 RepID=A0ABQ7EIX3_BRACR|nr:hypothetical protein DY000_02020303 [Brassica cretica]